VGELHAEREQRVTPLELFFDLVFVFAFTQVTTVLSDNPTWSGLGHALLILGVLWWAWASYAWLTNTVDPGLGVVSAAMVVAMAAMFVAALTVPDAFGSHGVAFGVAFLIVNVMHLTLYALSARGDPDLLAAILRVAPSALVGAALILVAGFVGGGLKAMLWLAALAVGYLEPLLVGMRGWRVQPAHFVERHGLIVIIAIGESLIAIGLGENDSGFSTGVIVAAVLGFAVATSFWLAYFDFFPIRAQQILTDRSGVERTALARDVYTYLHLPMGGRNSPLRVRDEEDARRRRRRARHDPGAGTLRRSRAIPVRLRGSPRARLTHARPRTPDRRHRLRLAVAGGPCRAGHSRAHTRGNRLGRTSRLRTHLVARGPRTDTSPPSAGLIRTRVTTSDDRGVGHRGTTGCRQAERAAPLRRTAFPVRALGVTTELSLSRDEVWLGTPSSPYASCGCTLPQMTGSSR
jgi:low temperature requirement protein LtrA